MIGDYLLESSAVLFLISLRKKAHFPSKLIEIAFLNAKFLNRKKKNHKNVKNIKYLSPKMRPA